MALIFSPSVKAAYAYQVFGATDLTSFNGANNVRITVYGGTQPSAAAFFTNFNTTYSSTQAVFLADFGLHTWTRGANSWSMTTFPSAANASRAGVATWAALWMTTSASPVTSSAPTSNFILVPVTSTADNGVIRFTSTSFTSGQSVQIIDGGFSIL